MPHLSLRALTAGLLATGVALSPVAAPSASASTDGSGLVVSEVYGGGGNTGATYTNDFIELYNPTAAAIDVSNLSVQYRSASGSGAFAATRLTGSVPSHGHYLVAEAKGTGGSTPLPTPDATGTIAMSGTTGTVLLAAQPTALTVPTGNVTGNPAVLDLVGFGGSNTFEASSAPAPSNSASIARAATGTDSDVNSADFTAGAPSPASTGGTDPGDPGDPLPAEAHTIAEIQGSTDTSPYVGKSVVTDGVVTASYPTGGFRGFYLQTPGTGGDLTAGHTASDAVFVYLGNQTAYPQIGDHVKVTGAVSEFAGLTEVSAAADGVVADTDPATAVKPVTNAYPATATGREALEGMVFAPGAFTVTDVYTLNNFGEINLASGAKPLIQPTDVARPGSADYAAVVADNAARGVVLDDGSSTNYLTTGKDTPLPWITRDKPIRVGAHATFTHPVVLDYRNDEWKFQPTSQLTADNDASVAPATFPNTRPAAPTPVAGALKSASFNVLNSFTETGEKYVASGGTCSSYSDRAGVPVTVNDCGPTGPRGAWGD
ncbi:MAG: multifunctional nuclease/2,3-cyclic-nucleotide, partial [Nocardioidaceae bacterium]|nr:multifunctional nuclease/2,3-cyclic-nucleotide [Nocardioidaceae bacterium]